VFGDGVVVGIIDGGLDWLHQDFIDSAGNTRIKYFWDQTDPTGPAPSNPQFGYGTELDYATNQDRNQSCSSCPLCDISDSGGFGIEIIVL
jgi:subtilisin family serine protease